MRVCVVRPNRAETCQDSHRLVNTRRNNKKKLQVQIKRNVNLICAHEHERSRTLAGPEVPKTGLPQSELAREGAYESLFNVNHDNS